MCTEICAKPLKALLSEAMSLLQLILVLIIAVASLCQPPDPSLRSSNLKATNTQTEKSTPKLPNLTPSLHLQLDLVCWNGLAEGLLIPAASKMEWHSVMSDLFGLCPNVPGPKCSCAQIYLCPMYLYPNVQVPNVPVPGWWQRLIFLLWRTCFKGYNLRCLVKLKSPWPLDR